MKEKLDTIHIFLLSGKTFTFHDITLLCDKETVVSFTYTAMSDGRTKTVTFYKAHGVVGVSKVS